jgi:N6-adenosine-specific RNA methylase IME4
MVLKRGVAACRFRAPLYRLWAYPCHTFADCRSFLRELFARETKPNWHCWGDQVGLFNRGAVATRRQPSRLIGEPFELPLRP